ncbi:MAG: hypothetical protein LBT36_04065, partial [Oscillospiraceae bacterium]|nr:hypothetical protein [Oscillospiraceae bacterium]
MFHSILFPTREQHGQPRQETEPEYFKDMNLDQIFNPILTPGLAVDPILARGRGPEMKSLFFTPLRDPEIITYRQEVLRELEDEELRALVVGFSQTLFDIQAFVKMVQDSISSRSKLRDNYLTRGSLLDCAERYIEAVDAFAGAYTARTFASAGMRAFAEYIRDYCASEHFQAMREHTRVLREELSTVEYCMLIKYGTIRVRKYEGQSNYAEDILTTFSKFSQAAPHDYRLHLSEEPYDTRMEATVLGMVAGFYKKIFANLNSFCDKYFAFEDETVERFVTEVQFYLAWLEFIAPIQEKGLR